jgi:hypothetical protein
MFKNFFFQKSHRLCDNVDICATATQAKDDDIIRHTRSAFWVTKAADTHSEYVQLTVFHCNNGFMDAPQYYVYIYIGCPVEC